MTKEFRDYLQKKVLEAYEQQAAKGESSPVEVSGVEEIHDAGDIADDDVL